MIDSILGVVSQNGGVLNAAAAFICGACLMYLAMARTIRKRERERLEGGSDA